jgi:hypothetical protein
VPGLRRQRSEKSDSSFFYRGLTARPVVLAKTFEPGASSFLEMTIRAGRSFTNPQC